MKDLDWEDLHEQLLRRRLARETIGSSIVRLGKPYDVPRIQKAKAAVLQYLKDDDPVVRREALWFVGSWGKLRECLPGLIQRMRNDSFEDNRAFAALCVGRTMAGSKDPLAVAELLQVLNNDQEETFVRVSAYRALLLVMKERNADREASDFHREDRGLNDIDWNWVRQLQA